MRCVPGPQAPRSAAQVLVSSRARFPESRCPDGGDGSTAFVILFLLSGYWIVFFWEEGGWRRVAALWAVA